MYDRYGKDFSLDAPASESILLMIKQENNFVHVVSGRSSVHRTRKLESAGKQAYSVKTLFRVLPQGDNRTAPLQKVSLVCTTMYRSNDYSSASTNSYSPEVVVMNQYRRSCIRLSSIACTTASDNWSIPLKTCLPDMLDNADQRTKCLTGM